MNPQELDDMISIFTKDLGLTKEQLGIVRMLCSDVERTTRQKAVSLAYDLANSINNMKGEK